MTRASTAGRAQDLEREARELWRRSWLTLTLLLAGGCGRLFPPASVPADRPVDWSGEPVQTDTRRSPFTWVAGKETVTLNPRAAFDCPARVASAEHYSWDDGAFLAPVDLVLLWGKLPTPPYKDEVSYSQITRYYFWRTSSTSLDLEYIQSHSANMHPIPGTANLRRALLAVSAGDDVRVRGLLVDAGTARGFTWNTSLTRLDSGPGACELVWVEELQNGSRLYH
ncbi:MAG: hypothetical protein M3O15_13845 [Acidobacteriota bacterium]|nr:hypothetical protein [Acidobacteriota bacterium]